MWNKAGEEHAINEEENEKSEDKEGKRKEKSNWKITLKVQVQLRPTSNKDSAIFSVSSVFKGVLWAERKYLNAEENLGPRTWIPGPAAGQRP